MSQKILKNNVSNVLSFLETILICCNGYKPNVKSIECCKKVVKGSVDEFLRNMGLVAVNVPEDQIVQ